MSLSSTECCVEIFSVHAHAHIRVAFVNVNWTVELIIGKTVDVEVSAEFEAFSPCVEFIIFDKT